MRRRWGGCSNWAVLAMRRLSDEVLRRFPEVAARVRAGDEELPYVMIRHIVEWLLTVAKPGIDPAVIRRVVDFERWCRAQPPGRTADDDVMTIVSTALHEKLFRYDVLLPLVPRLMSREELLVNRDHFTGTVGPDRYQAALRLSAGGA